MYRVQTKWLVEMVGWMDGCDTWFGGLEVCWRPSAAEGVRINARCAFEIILRKAARRIHM